MEEDQTITRASRQLLSASNLQLSDYSLVDSERRLRRHESSRVYKASELYTDYLVRHTRGRYGNEFAVKTCSDRMDRDYQWSVPSAEIQQMVQSIQNPALRIPVVHWIAVFSFWETRESPTEMCFIDSHMFGPQPSFQVTLPKFELGQTREQDPYHPVLGWYWSTVQCRPFIVNQDGQQLSTLLSLLEERKANVESLFWTIPVSRMPADF